MFLVVLPLARVDRFVTLLISVFCQLAIAIEFFIDQISLILVYACFPNAITLLKAFQIDTSKLFLLQLFKFR